MDEIKCPECNSNQIVEIEYQNEEIDDVEQEQLYQYQCTNCGHVFNVDE